MHWTSLNLICWVRVVPRLRYKLRHKNSHYSDFENSPSCGKINKKIASSPSWLFWMQIFHFRPSDRIRPNAIWENMWSSEYFSKKTSNIQAVSTKNYIFDEVRPLKIVGIQINSFRPLRPLKNLKQFIKFAFAPAPPLVRKLMRRIFVARSVDWDLNDSFLTGVNFKVLTRQWPSLMFASCTVMRSGRWENIRFTRSQMSCPRTSPNRSMRRSSNP